MKQKTKFKQTEIGMIPENWEVKEAKELCEVTSSKRIFQADYVSGGIPFYRSKEIIEKSQGMVITTKIFISEERFNQIKEKFGAPIKGDLLLSSVGARSGIPYFVEDNQEFYFKDGNLIWFRKFKESIIQSKFLYYLLSSEIGQNQLNTVMIGSAQPALTIEGISGLPILLPSKEEQSSIAKILSDLDSKIELNQQMNKTLEAIGQAIFKHWFIDFEFPNEKGKPYKSSGGEMVESELGDIPKGWKVGKLGEFVNVIKGVSYKSEELKNSDKALVTLKSIDRGGGLNKNGFKEFIGKYKKEQEIIDGDIVVAHTDITQKAEVLGKPAIVRMIQEYNTLIASLDLAIVRPKDNTTNKPYLYYLLKSENFQNHAFGYANGTTVLHLSSKAIPEYLFVVPDKKLILKFGESIEKLLDKKKKSEAETENLILVRDSLLPKLMSGKIRVPVEVK